MNAGGNFLCTVNISLVTYVSIFLCSVKLCQSNFSLIQNIGRE
jgi:hypothetical protein